MRQGIGIQRQLPSEEKGERGMGERKGNGGGGEGEEGRRGEGE